MSEVLHLALPSGSRLLTGPEQLGRMVSWARLLGTRSGGLGPVEAGEVILCAGSSLGSAGGEKQLARLVGDLVEAGCAGIFVSGAYPPPLPAICGEAGLPLVQVPPGVQLSEVERSVIGLIVDRDGQLQRRLGEIRDRVITGLVSNAGLAAIVSTLAAASGKRIFVLDEYLSLQAAAPAEGEFGRKAERTVAEMLPRGPGELHGRATRARTIELNVDGAQLAGCLQPVFLSGVWAGFMGVLGDRLDSGIMDGALAEQTAPLVAIELAKQRAVDEATLRLRGDFLEDLLEGNDRSEESILARARWLGHDLARPHLTFALGVAESEPVGPSSVSLLDARQRKRFVDQSRALLLKAQPDTLLLERNGLLLVLMPRAEVGDVELDVERVEELRSRLGQALGDLRCAAGIGRHEPGIAGYRRASAEAEQALKISQRLLGGGLTVHYANLGVERLIFPLLETVELAAFVDDMIGPLLQYDAGHRTELAGTLEVFFACNGNHVRAAQELHLHRNTLLYRLDRAREILSRDLDDVTARLAVQMALQIRRALPTAPD
ncbi:MAG: helix-turn-helix domain-containing protein [Chloroflexi bacterium]|nr:helix-turn-helix domain-containing protein [Chloroflexota bacterium]